MNRNHHQSVFSTIRCASGVFLLLFVTASSAFGQSDMTNAPAQIAGNLPAMGPSIVRVFGALALVIALFLGGVWLFRNWQRFVVRKNGAPRLNVLEVKSLGQRQSLFVVAYQQQRMLLASSPTGVTLVSHLPAGEEEAEKEPAREIAPRMSFAEAFQHVLARK